MSSSTIATHLGGAASSLAILCPEPFARLLDGLEAR